MFAPPAQNAAGLLPSAAHTKPRRGPGRIGLPPALQSNGCSPSTSSAPRGSDCPSSTLTRSRLADSIRRAGNSRITAISSANRVRRPAFRCTNRPFEKLRVLGHAPKVPAPSQQQRLLHRSLQPVMALLRIAVLVRAGRIGVPRLHPVILHQPFVALVELLQIAHVIHRARQAVGAVFGRYRSQLPDCVLPSFAEALQGSPNSRSCPSPSSSTSARSGTPGARTSAPRA